MANDGAKGKSSSVGLRAKADRNREFSIPDVPNGVYLRLFTKLRRLFSPSDMVFYGSYIWKALINDTN